MLHYYNIFIPDDVYNFVSTVSLFTGLSFKEVVFHLLRYSITKIGSPKNFNDEVLQLHLF